MVLYIITGRPGIGKSTLFTKIMDRLRESGFIVGGFKAPEVRDRRGFRIGFKVVDLMDGEEAWLARKNYYSNIRVGRYGVLVEEASRVIAKALRNAIDRAQVIGVDEVGPMELKIPVFREMLDKILEIDKPRVLVVHYRLSDLGIVRRGKKYIVTLANRDSLAMNLPDHVLEAVKKHYSRRLQ